MSRPLAVIIEGPDGAGKSTLAEQLATSMGLVLRHTGPPKTSALDECAEMLKLHDRTGLGVAFDRFHLGERVYGPVFRGVDTLGDEGQRSLEATLQSSFRPILVRCLPPWPVVQGNWRATREQQMLQDEAPLLRVYEEYAQLARIKVTGVDRLWTTLPIFDFDYTQDAVTSVLRRLEAL